MINPMSIPAGLAWIQYISPPAYAYKGLVQNEFEGLEFECEQFSLNQNLPCFTTGEQVIAYYNLKSISIYFNLGMLWVLTLVLHVFGYVLLRHSTRPKGKII
eukprot:Partr_v1_DN27961_c0_g2_i2_m11678